MPTRVALFPLLSKHFTTDLTGVTFTLSSKTATGGHAVILGQGGNIPLNAVLTSAVSVQASGTSNGCF
jgi:hypothetical protein